MADKIASNNGQSIPNNGVLDKKSPSNVNRFKKKRNINAKPAAFGATDKKAVTVVGDPS